MIKAPKDLKLKVATKEEALWDGVRKEAIDLIEQSENSLIIQRAMLKMAEAKIKEQQCISRS